MAKARPTCGELHNISPDVSKDAEEFKGCLRMEQPASSTKSLPKLTAEKEK